MNLRSSIRSVVLLVVAHAAQDGVAAGLPEYCRPDVFDRDDLGYFVGTYDVIGRDYRTGRAFAGVGKFSLSDTLNVQWQSAGASVSGTATTERCGPDKLPILRIAFRQGDMAMEGQCRVSSELDNYPRITCEIARRDRAARKRGLLAFFYRHEGD